jgi:hypothetical protein
MQEQILDGLAIDQVRPLSRIAQSNNKADYGKMIRETEAFSPEAEV